MDDFNTTTPTAAPVQTPTAPAVSIPVMDVAAPPRPTTPSPSTTFVPPASENPALESSDNSYSSGQYITTPQPLAVTEAPVAPPVVPEPETIVSTTEPNPALEQMMGPTPDTAPPQSGATTPTPPIVGGIAVAAPAAGSHKAPKAAVIVAIVIAIILAGLAIFAYLKTKNMHNMNMDQTSTSNTTTQATVPATAADVDATTKSIDSSLGKTDDSKDFTSNDLSDTTLGL